jgi:glycosyltransferase involved in cell wall biosynthesis
METGPRLTTTATKREPLEQACFDEFVRSHLSGRIEYAGEAGHDGKAELLQDARAMPVPISREEPRGLVMIEAMACGMP